MPLHHVARPAVRSAAAVVATLAAGAAHAQSPAGALPDHGQATSAGLTTSRRLLLTAMPAAVPEPASVGLVVAGVLATVGATERRRREVAA